MLVELLKWIARHAKAIEFADDITLLKSNCDVAFASTYSVLRTHCITAKSIMNSHLPMLSRLMPQDDILAVLHSEGKWKPVACTISQLCSYSVVGLLL